MTTPADPRGPVPDVDPLDELASALVDGEATEAESARAPEPEVAVRVATFAAVAAKVGVPIPAPADADREQTIAAALAAASVEDHDAGGETVVAMRPTGRRRRRPPQWLPAAAAIAVAVAGLGLLVSAIGSTGDSDEAATGDAATEEAATLETQAGAGGENGQASSDDAGDSTTAEAPSAGGSAADNAAPFSTTDLGDVDVAALEAALRGRAAGPAPATTAAEDGDEQFEGEGEDAGGRTTEELGRFDVPCAEEFGTSLVAVFTARLDGVPVTVGLFEAPAGVFRYHAVDQATCDVVASADL